MADNKHSKSLSEKLKNFELDTLLSVTQSINNNSSRRVLLELFEKILTQDILIGRVLLYVFDGSWSAQINQGIEQTPEISYWISKFPQAADYTILSEIENNPFPNLDVLIPVYHKESPRAFLLLGNVEGEKVQKSPIEKHLPFIRTLTNIVITALHNRRLYNQNILQATMHKELELASEMQNLLIPKSLPNDNELEMAAFYKPHGFIGGDYYDFVKINDKESIICIADVSGKGVSAGLIMANLQANLRILSAHTDSLEQLTIELNQNLYANTNGEKFITAFLAKYNQETRRFTYINAGHNPPILINGDNVKKLETGCTILGAFKNLPDINKGMFILKKPAMLFCYTDGLVELENEEKVPFGFENLNNYITDLKEQSANKIIQKIFEILELYKGSNDFHDDVTMLCCKYH